MKTTKNSGSQEIASKKMNVKIILGSTRQGRMSEKIGDALQHMLEKRADVSIRTIDLKEYHLPFLDDATPPASRKVITDPLVQKWSDAIKEADAFIIVVPEYNAGYPGVLKNALDSLYTEWNNKPVGFVGYAGGPTGGANAIAQLRTVVRALQMKPIDTEFDITIPSSWKAVDTRGKLVDQNIEQDFGMLVDQLVGACAQ